MEFPRDILLSECTTNLAFALIEFKSSIWKGLNWKLMEYSIIWTPVFGKRFYQKQTERNRCVVKEDGTRLGSIDRVIWPCHNWYRTVSLGTTDITRSLHVIKTINSLFQLFNDRCTVEFIIPKNIQIRMGHRAGNHVNKSSHNYLYV